jgi:ribonuclease BN (tRNA processing enzyme)
VISGDTRKYDPLAEFASGADGLVQDCCVGPVDEATPDPEQGLVWEERIKALPKEARTKLRKTHCTPEDVGEIAATADVDTVIPTHLLPYRDIDAIREQIKAVFDVDVIVGRDGLTLSAGGTQR